MENRANNDEIDLREYLRIIGQHWKLIVATATVLMTIAFIYSLMQKPLYEAKTVLLIRSGGSGGLSQLAMLANVPANLQSAGPGQDLQSLLSSNALAAEVINKINLRERISGWNSPKWKEFQLASAVRGMLKVPKMIGSTIELKVNYYDPAIAADVANGYADALVYSWNKLNYTEARNKREYIESQLPRVEKALSLAAMNLKRFTLLSGGGSGVEVARLNGELEIQRSVYTMLRTEYETVKLEESKQVQPFQVLDKAVVPERPISPNIKGNTIIGLTLGLILGLFLSFFLEYWNKSQS